ncbi:MAG TPA: hypothetical protein VFQ61_06195 [Polyangiaceae bacterium]|nr:hypothetical protein [Polyangiaceae bacterium]
MAIAPSTKGVALGDERRADPRNTTEDDVQRFLDGFFFERSARTLSARRAKRAFLERWALRRRLFCEWRRSNFPIEKLSCWQREREAHPRQRISALWVATKAGTARLGLSLAPAEAQIELGLAHCLLFGEQHATAEPSRKTRRHSARQWVQVGTHSCVTTTAQLKPSAV